MADEKPRKYAGNTRPDGRPVGSPFEKGNSGRPKGSRNRLSEAFIEALADDFDAHGPVVIETVRLEKPDQYLKVIASILPKDLKLTVNEFDGMSDAELIERLQELDAVIRPFIEAADVEKVH